MHGGASVWVTGSYDPQSNLTYWGIGNPGPDWNSDERGGANLYSDSVVALDADTGKLKWYFQFSPHDDYDYDSVQVPVLADMEWKGQTRRVMLWANRNGFYYVLDRTTGEFLLGQPFVRKLTSAKKTGRTWMETRSARRWKEPARTGFQPRSIPRAWDLPEAGPVQIQAPQAANRFFNRSATEGGTRPDTSPPNEATSRTICELMKDASSLAIRKMVSMRGLSRRFISAICNSIS